MFNFTSTRKTPKRKLANYQKYADIKTRDDYETQKNNREQFLKNFYEKSNEFLFCLEKEKLNIHRNKIYLFCAVNYDIQNLITKILFMENYTQEQKNNFLSKFIPATKKFWREFVRKFFAKGNIIDINYNISLLYLFDKSIPPIYKRRQKLLKIINSQILYHLNSLEKIEEKLQELHKKDSEYQNPTEELNFFSDLFYFTNTNDFSFYCEIDPIRTSYVQDYSKILNIIRGVKYCNLIENKNC